MRLLLSRAESAARGYVLTNDPNLVKEFNRSRDQIIPALADLIEATKDNPVQTRLLDNSRELIARRLAVSAELLRLQAAGDSAGIAALNAKAEGRAGDEHDQRRLRQGHDRGTAAADNSDFGFAANRVSSCSRSISPARC